MTPQEARAYVKMFQTYTMPGTTFVKTNQRTIYLDQMTDDDAVFVAGEFQRMETEAAARSSAPRMRQ